jgi:hypothetical protein
VRNGHDAGIGFAVGEDAPGFLPVWLKMLEGIFFAMTRLAVLSPARGESVKYIQARSPFNRHAPRLSLYYLQRLMTSPGLRALAIRLLQRGVALRTGRTDRKPDEHSQLSALCAEGIAALGQLLSPQQCEDIRHYLADKPLTHRTHAAFSLAARPADIALANHALADLVACPHILALANSPALLALATGYLGCTPTISGLSARWSFPSCAPGEVVQRFHRDSEDWLAFRVMVYLTPVDDAAGPHVYVRGTHLDRRTRRLPVLDDAQVHRRYGDRIVRQTGAPGCGFAVDTAGLHKGEVPSGAPRLLLSVQYSILPCFLYEYEPARLPASLFDAYVNRLIVRRPRYENAHLHGTF